MPDTITYQDQEYPLVRKLNFGEVRQFQKALGNLLGFEDKVKNADEKQLEKIARDASQSTDEQMELVIQTLKDCLGFDQEKINKLDFLTAVVLFNEIFTTSTTLKKKSNQPYA